MAKHEDARPVEHSTFGEYFRLTTALVLVRQTHVQCQTAGCHAHCAKTDNERMISIIPCEVTRTLREMGAVACKKMVGGVRPLSRALIMEMDSWVQNLLCYTFRSVTER